MLLYYNMIIFWFLASTERFSSYTCVIRIRSTYIPSIFTNYLKYKGIHFINLEFE